MTQCGIPPNVIRRSLRCHSDPGEPPSDLAAGSLKLPSRLRILFAAGRAAAPLPRSDSLLLSLLLAEPPNRCAACREPAAATAAAFRLPPSPVARPCRAPAAVPPSRPSELDDSASWSAAIERRSAPAPAPALRALGDPSSTTALPAPAPAAPLLPVLLPAADECGQCFLERLTCALTPMTSASNFAAAAAAAALASSLRLSTQAALTPCCSALLRIS